MKDMILFPEDIDRLNTVLEQLTSKANLLLSVLINKDGRLLTFQGSLDKIDTVSMAALVAGNSASTLAIANLMGETEFSAMYHQGKERHIYIAVVDENTFLCLVFDDRTNIDRVKVFARQFDRQIKKALIMVYDKTEDQVDLDLDLGLPSLPQTSRQATLSQESAYQQDPEPLFQKQDIHIQDLAPGISNAELPHDTDDSVHITDLNASTAQKPAGDVHDTNYLHLKKKIRKQR